MIYVRFIGGLGNQLFQYATARGLAARHGTEVVGDLANYGARFPGRRPLKRLDRPFDLARLSPRHLRQREGWQAWLVHRRAKLSHPQGLRFAGMTYRDRGYYDPALHELPDGVMLNGFFQSERYFAEIADELRAEFRPNDPALRARVEGGVAAVRRPGRPLVSVHVRRGDFLTARGGNSLALDPDHIRAGMRRFPDADFLVFSDDLAWSQAELGGDGVSFSSFRDAIEDFYAMSLCDHHIIANSTFSWWAAWVDPKPDKRVLAPTDWHRSHPRRWRGDEEIYAEGWERY